MFGMIWVVLFVALTGLHLGYGLPVRPTPQTYPHDGQSLLESWTSQGGLYAAIPVLALVITAIVVLVGCTWCYRHKDCKPNEGADNQLFSASASHLQTPRVPAPDSGFSEPVNNNISEDNNNGPISLREMQNIANNNAAAYIVSENEERNRISRESVVEFEPLPLPTGIIGPDPLEHCADWFATEDFPRNSLQYLREIGRGWFGRVVEGEIEEAGSTSTVAVKILNQNASPHDKARFLDEANMFRDLSHEQILGYLGKCVNEDPWILIFELCSTNLQQYLVMNRPHMTVLNESGAPLQLMCDVTSALAHLHSAGYTYGRLWSGSVMVRGEGENARAVLGRYEVVEPHHDIFAPEVTRRGAAYTAESEIWSLGSLIWEVCSWGSVPTGRPSPPPDLPCPYKSHLYQVMQLCWHTDPSSRPSAAQVHALIQHLHVTHTRVRLTPVLTEQDTDFEERWQRLKPNTIPKVDEHVAIVHAPSTSELEPTLLTVGSAVSRSSSITSDRDPLSTQIKSESLTNLHGSLEDVRNIYLTHNETPLLECHQGNMLDNERDADCSDASVDPWLKDIIAGSQDDVSYYRDVSDVIKNLDNILNSEKTSSSESSHQASPSRDNLSLDCKKEYPVQSSLVKSPGISNFQNILDTGFASGDQENEPGIDDEVDRDTIGTLSHSFERHSDTTSQQTLENLTPDTPMKDVDIFGKIEVQVDIERLEDDVTEAPKSEDHELSQTEIESDLTENVESTYVAYTEPESIENTSSKPIETFESIIIEDAAHETVENEPDRTKDTELPNQIIDNKVPELKQLCEVSVPSISETEDQLIIRKDCETSCDNAITTDREETKSVVDVRISESVPESMPLAEIEVTDLVEMPKETAIKIAEETILPKIIEDSTASNEGIDTLPSVTDDVFNITQENEVSLIKESNTEDIEPESLETENNYSKDETILVSDLIDTVTDSSKDQPVEPLDVDQTPPTEQIPVSVQTNVDEIEKTAHFNKLKIETILPPEIVQNTSNSASLSESGNLVNKDKIVEEDNLVSKDNEEAMPRSDNFVVKEQSNCSTVYMDLINNTNSQILNDSVTSNNANESVNEAKTNDNINKHNLVSAMQTCDASLYKTESTVYLDLPSFEVIKYTDDFLQMERMISSGLVDKTICASTPIASDSSTNNTLENTKDSETLILSDNKVPDASISKEQKSVQDNVSPFDSPSKSHLTDTYDENSSVVLGPFENCNLEVFKTGKPIIDLVELPKEELLAFSSNFSEINLETPSPLRDGNFLNEVPDILSDDVQFDDLASISEPKQEPPSDATDSKSGTEKRVSPSTPPNSPGIFLASTSQPKYLVDIDLNNAPEVELIPVQNEIDLNQIELQITSKLAMAENENNLNIEYSGPLTVEGLIEEGEITRDSDAIPEMFLAGNVNGMEDARDEIPLDEECVKALRNELELKLPLAQVAAIEPQGEGEWSSELPPPPELIVSYPGALSPIAEETGQQLSAYENDAQWNASVRTESSSSYPEPCNSQSCTEQPTHEHTYTLPEHEQDLRTYTIVKDIATSSREITMSADSLNCSPRRLPKDDVLSPIDDRTYNKDDVVDTCDRISQVSPFLVSPTTDTSVPSDNCDNATGVSTLSKTTLPTDAKLSKPTETQCLSKATSIDSWCSNDTLYNVEENFEDLAMDPDVPTEFEPNEDNSESTDTLTHNEDEKEHSNCSTYIIHDSKSEPCETFSPDSITANDNYTYTKAKTDQAGTTPSNHTELNDSTKNTQTKDLAYGTMPTFSNCTTEVMSGFEEAWKLPELVRKSPISEDINISPPKGENVDNKEFSSPQFSSDPTVNKMESIEISFLKDNLVDSPKSDTETGNIVKMENSPNYNYRNMTPSLTSTPLVDLAEPENFESIPMVLPEIASDEPNREVNALYFQNYQKSTETKPQGLVPEVLLLENTTNISAANTTPSYTDFENSALRKPQDLNATDGTSQMESASSDGFKHFEESVKNCPQDLSSLIDASSRLLESERLSSDAIFPQSLIITPNIRNLREYDIETNDLELEPTGSYLINFGPDDETEQPHSIIVTEIPMTITKASPNKTYDSRTENESNQTYDSHIHTHRTEFEIEEPKVNGDIKHDEIENIVTDTIEMSSNEEITNVKAGTQSDETTEIQNTTNGSQTEASPYEEITNVTTDILNEPSIQNLTNGSHEKETPTEADTTDKVSSKIANFATVNFLNESFEELIESNVDEADQDKSDETITSEIKQQIATPINSLSTSTEQDKPDTTETEPSKTTLNLVDQQNGEPHVNGVADVEKMTTVTQDFLHNEKNYCQLDSYLPLLSDIRFTGPATEIMSTSFTQDSPTSPTSPENEPNKPDPATEIMKDWDSDTDSHSSNSSSGEFIWKDGDGHETSVVPSTHFEHQRGSGENNTNTNAQEPVQSGERDGASSGSAESGSEGSEVEFVPSSWDCRAAPAKSSLRSVEHAQPVDNMSKKRVVFKRQKYHCVYEYPREVNDIDQHSPAYLPDFSTYTEWDPSNAEEAELCYGQLFSSPSALSAGYPLRAGIAFGADYDEDFFISSSARPFESLGIMSTTSQFFPGMHVKPSLLERDLSDDVTEEFPPPPSPLPSTTLVQSRTPSLDFTTPDSGVEDITPGSTTDEDFKKKLPESDMPWRMDSGSSSESVSPSSPGGEALGGLRHTRDKLKLDLPPSPHVPSPRHNRVFNFVLDKPKRRQEDRPPTTPTPLVMTDETPVVTTNLPLHSDDEVSIPEPTFSTFGKSVQKVEPEQKIILDEVTQDAEHQTEVKDESPKVVEAVKGEGTVLDSGDEDSGIESSSKATLERNKTQNIS